MSNAGKQNKYPNQSANIRTVTQQNTNTRGPTPVDNQQRQDYRPYSSVTRTGLVPSHDISKSQTGGTPLITQQPSLGPQVASITSQVPPPQMSSPSVGAQSPAQTQAIQAAQQVVMTSAGGRYAPGNAFHAPHTRPSQGPRQGPMMHHRTQNSMPQPPNVVQQSVPQNAGSTNMTHSNHQHYYIVPPQFPPQSSVMMNPAQHMSHVYQTPSTGYQMPTRFVYYSSPINQPQYNYAYTAYGQTPLMPPQLQSRGPPVTNPPNVQPINVQVGGAVPSNTEMNDVSQHQTKHQPLVRRERNPATITNPNTGQVITEQELKTKPETGDVQHVSEPIAGNANLRHSPTTSTVSGDKSVGLQFTTDVLRKAFEPSPSTTEPSPQTSSTDITEMDVTETHSDVSEKVNISVSASQKITELIVNNTDDLQSADTSVSETDKSDNLQENFILTQQSEDSQSHSVSENKLQGKCSERGHELQHNGETHEIINANLLENDDDHDDDAKDHQMKVNVNQRKIETIVKDDETVPDELSNVKMDSVNTSTSTIDSSELSSNHSTPNTSVMISKEETKDRPNQLDNECDMLENMKEVEKKNAENIRMRINDENTIDLNEKSLSDVEITPKSDVKTLPDLPYAENQWTPLNPDGKKKYERDFLIALQNSAVSLKKPEKLSQSSLQDIVRDKPHAHDNMNQSGGGVYDDPFLPGYATIKPGHYRHAPQSVTRRQSQPGRGGHMDKHRKVISTSLTQDVKLHTTDNAWKPKKLAAEPIEGDEKETLELLKAVRGILNKLTPQKYDALLKQIMDYKVDTEDKLMRVLDLVFEKAVDEPAFCLQYANLCKHLAQMKVYVTTGDNSAPEEVKFQKLLLSKCQKEFETDVYAGIEDMQERQKEIEECQETDRKKYLHELLDEDMRRARKRSLGNIKLIGELYKLKLLKGNIMLQCIDKLCTDFDDESLECLCALLKTIGVQIENDNFLHKRDNKNILDEYFNFLLKIATSQISDNKSKTSARVRFMLQDVIDLRKNNWKPRRDENMPKMIEEIHQEAKKEEEQRAQDLEKHTMQKRMEQESHKRKGRQNDGEGWHTVARKSQTLAPQTIDWHKMRSMAQGQETLQLGPSGSSTWSQGSRGGAQTSQSKLSSNAEDNRLANRFHALEQTPNDSRKSQNKSNDVSLRDSSKGRSMQSGSGGRRLPTQRNSEHERDRAAAINSTRIINSRPGQSIAPPFSSNVIVQKNSSRSNSRDNSAPSSRSNSMRRQTPDCEYKRLKGKDIPHEEFHRKATNIIKEYLSNDDLNAAIEDVIDLCNENNVDLYISTAINYALEISSQKDHICLGKLLCKLVVEEHVKLDLFIKGLSSILEVADELEIDVPKIWDYLSEVLSPIFIDLPDPPDRRRNFLVNVAKSCKANNGPKLIAKMVKEIAKRLSPDNFTVLWSNTRLQWSDILSPDNDVDEFIKRNGLEFSMSLHSNSINQLPIEQRLQHLSEDIPKMVRSKKSNPDIQNYIAKYYSAKETDDSLFTSALFKAVIKGCLKETEESMDYTRDSLDNYSIKDKAPLLQKFLGGDAEKELQALLILQQLMEELQHPAGLLPIIFHVLYDSEVISHDAFLQWEKHPNIHGKGMAVQSATRFLAWLRENEDDDDDNDQDAAN